MRSRLLTHARRPLLWALDLCSFTATAEQDALRVLDIDPTSRKVNVKPGCAAERSEMLLRALATPGVRSVFYHRLSQGSTSEKLMCIILERLYPGGPGIEIRCDDIGPGFLLGHGQSVVVWARRIGSNCTIHQHCTVGLSDATFDTLPVLGDRVWLWPLSAVIGVNVEDDATVGAGAIVLKDVPAGRTAVGVPARLL